MSKIEIPTPTVSVETDPDKNFRHSLAMLATHIQGRCYDPDIPATILLESVEGRCRDIREMYLPTPASQEHA